jgi:hypothetical protein
VRGEKDEQKDKNKRADEELKTIIKRGPSHMREPFLFNHLLLSHDLIPFLQVGHDVFLQVTHVEFSS